MYQGSWFANSANLKLKGSSHFDLVLVVEDLESFAILDHLRALFKLQLEEGVGDDTDSDVDSLDVVLDLRDCLFDVG